jgi:hypothetical protein
MDSDGLILKDRYSGRQGYIDTELISYIKQNFPEELL